MRDSSVTVDPRILGVAGAPRQRLQLRLRGCCLRAELRELRHQLGLEGTDAAQQRAHLPPQDHDDERDTRGRQQQHGDDDQHNEQGHAPMLAMA